MGRTVYINKDINNMATAKQRRLQAVLLPLSEEKDDWEVAKLEWSLHHVSYKTNKCVCGQKIEKNCHMKNIKTLSDELKIVGSCCVKQFICVELGKTGETLVKAIQAIADNPTSRVGQSTLVNFVKEKGKLTDCEEGFLHSIGMKREAYMTEKQVKWLSSLNKKMVACAQALEDENVDEDIDEDTDKEVEEVEEARVKICVEQLETARKKWLINDWEVKFIHDMNNKKESDLTEKQLNKLTQITSKLSTLP